MKRFETVFARAAVVLAVLAFFSGPSAEPAARGLDTLVEWMTGSFSSAEQAAADSSYFDIRLRMVRVWPARTDGYWLYVEQAAAARLDRPYRQRVYHVTQSSDGSFASEVFTIPGALRFAGAWDKPEPLAALAPDSLSVREGCAVILRWKENEGFAGAIEGQGCASDLRGASYATSEVIVKTDRLVSWDRGFDKNGKQVWGAEKGGYVFLKLSPSAAGKQTEEPME